MASNDTIISAQHAQLIDTLIAVNKVATKPAPAMIAVVGAGGKTHLIDWLARLLKLRGQRVCITTTTKMYLPSADHFDHLIDLSKHSFSDLALQGKAPNTTFIYQHQIVPSSSEAPVKVQGLSAPNMRQLRNSTHFDVLLVEADGAKHQPLKAPATYEPCMPEGAQIVIGVTGAEAIFCKADPDHIQRWSTFSALTGCLAGMTIDESVLKNLLASPQGMFKHAPAQAQRIWVINKYDRASDCIRLQALATRLINELPALHSIWLTQFNQANAISATLLRDTYSKTQQKDFNEDIK